MPFPRFVVNALRHLFEYSPFGFTGLLNKKEIASYDTTNTKKHNR